MTETCGLSIFVSVVIANAAGLLLDLLLVQLGRPTVTAFARCNPAVALCIVGANVLAVVGLAFHFWPINGGEW